MNYRARVAHTSRFGVPPTARFDLWERVNNNDGTWQPQIIYAVQDRVLHGDQLFEALHVHQAQPGQAPPDHPGLWQPLPTTAKEQLVTFCDPGDPEQAGFFDVGANGTEEDARAILGAALAVCHRIDPMPSAGITEGAVHFMLADGKRFRPEPTPGTAFYETMSRAPHDPASGLPAVRADRHRQREDHEARRELPAATAAQRGTTSSGPPTGRPSPPASPASSHHPIGPASDDRNTEAPSRPAVGGWPRQRHHTGAARRTCPPRRPHRGPVHIDQRIPHRVSLASSS